MSSNSTFTILKDTFGKQGSEEKVEGLTVVIDGKLKDIFDIIISKSDKYKDYTSVMTDVVLLGVNKIINELD